MIKENEIITERLLLNSFRVEEAELVAKLTGDIRVVEMTASIPYPYETEMAVLWIKGHSEQKNKYDNYIYAIRKKSSEELMGCINIGLNINHNRGYLGYWIGHDYWGMGFCTEAVKAIIKFGFDSKNLNKIWAEHKTHNVASGKVMEKAKMKHEGIMRGHYKQDNNNYLDMSVKSILLDDYLKYESY